MKEYFNLEYLNTFVVAAETGKLNVTAEIVHLSHSAVSIQIKRLEEQAGKALFIRNKDTLTLTRAGEVLLDYANHIIDFNRSAFQSLNNSGWEGHLTLGIPTDYAELFVTFIYPRLRLKLPNFDLTFVCDRSRNIRKLIEEGKIHVAMAAMEPQHLDDVLLWEEPLRWVCSKTFDLSSTEPLPVALFSDDCIVRNHSLYCLKKSNVSFSIVFTSTMQTNIADAVRAGIAVSLLPRSLITSDMKYLPEEYLSNPFTLRIGCTWSGNADPEILQTMITCMKEGILECGMFSG